MRGKGVYFVDRRWIVLWFLTIVAMILLLFGRMVGSRALANLGMISLSRSVFAAQDRILAGTYPLQSAAADDHNAQAAILYLQLARQLDDSRTIRQALGRTALAAGDMATAADVLQSLVRERSLAPLSYVDAMLALSFNGQFQDVIALHEAGLLFQHNVVVSDTVALAYLEQARFFIETGNWEAAVPLLQRSLELRPGDLYANWCLWQWAQKNGDMQAMKIHSQQLAYFPMSAVHPANERLLSLTTNVIPLLRNAGFWDRDQTLRVISFIVWQHFDVPEIEPLLKILALRYPLEVEWEFYLGELYHRRGDLERARAAYQAVLQADPAYAEAAFRLGAVSESLADWSHAAHWYTRYHEIVPEDIVGLARLASAYQELGRPETETKQDELRARLNDRETVAKILELSADSVDFGTIMLSEVDFEEMIWGQPKNWEIADYATGWALTDPQAAFFGGLDVLTSAGGARAARIDGLWMAEPRKGFFGFIHRPDARGGVYAIEVPPEQLCLISGTYRTGGEMEKTSIYLGNPQTTVLEGWLPPTNGIWRRFVLLGSHNSRSNERVQLILRMWGPGRVWFDDIQVVQVRVSHPHS